MGQAADSSVYDTNTAWLVTARQLGAVDTAEELKEGLMDTFPGLGIPGAIDLVTPILFPRDVQNKPQNHSYHDCTDSKPVQVL